MHRNYRVGQKKPTPYMKTTQLFRKHKGVLALLYVTMILIWLGVRPIFRVNFMEDKLTMLCCDLR